MTSEIVRAGFDGRDLDGSRNGRVKDISQSPIEILFTPEQKLDKGRQGLSCARRLEAIRAEVNLLSEEGGSEEDLREYLKSYVLHKQTAAYLIGPAKLEKSLPLTQLEIEDKARGALSRLVRDSGGTPAQAGQIPENKIQLTKRFQAARGVRDPFLEVDQKQK